MTRLLIHSSRPERVKALRAILLRAGDFDLSPNQTTVQGLHREMARHPSALALVEIGPEMSFDTLREIRRTSNFKILLWADGISTELAFEAMGLGIRGIMRDSLPPEVQVKCLRDVAEGALWFEKIFLESLPGTGIADRTAREARLVDVLAEGLKTKGSGSRLSRAMCKAGILRIMPNAPFLGGGLRVPSG